MEEYYDLAKELEMGTRRKKKTEEIIIENKLEKRWWNILEDGGVETEAPSICTFVC